MTDFSKYYEDAGKRFNVDPHLLRAIARQESGENKETPDSRSGAAGLMQIMPETAKSLGVNARDPVQSIYGAANLMNQLLKRYGNVPDALRDYNAGPDKSKWSNKETMAYVGSVADHYANLQKEADMAKKPQMAPAQTNDMDAFEKKWGISAGEGSSPAAEPHPDDMAVFEKKWGLSGYDVKSPPGKSASASAPTAPAPSQPEYEKHDWWDNALSGGKRGVRDVFDTGVNGADWAGNKLFGHTRLDDLKSYEDTARAQFDRDYGDSTAANIGRIAGNVAATAPIAGGALGIGGKLAASGARALGAGDAVAAASRWLAGNALAGASGDLATNSRTDESAWDSTKDGAALGLLAGGLGAVVKPVARYLGDSVTGGVIGKPRAELAKLASEKYGIALTAPQISNSQGMKNLATIAAGGATTPEQLSQFTRAVSHTFGADSDRLTPEVIDDAYNALGSRFDRASASTIIKADNQFGSDLGAIESEARQVLPESEVTPIVNQISNIMGKAANGEIHGSQYQALTRQGAPLSRAMRSKDQNVAYYAGRLRDAFDDAMERSLVADGKQDVLDDLRNARFQYKNLKTVEPLAAKSSENGGVLSPALLKGAVNKNFKNKARKGAAELGELADIAQAFLKDQPNSGTPGRFEAMGALTALPAAVATGSWELPATILGSAAMRGATRGVLDSKALAKSVVRRGLKSDQQENLLFKGIETARRGLPYATVVPGADAYWRNALTGYVQ